MIHLYALTATSVATDDLAGIDSSDVECLALDAGLNAVVGAMERLPSATRAAALEHADVVAAVTEMVPALPVQFGVRYDEVARLGQAVQENQQRLLDLLALVGGRVEYVLRVADPVHGAHATHRPARSSPSATPGRAYLEARLDEERAAQAAEDEVTRELDEVVEVLRPQACEVRATRGRNGAERSFLVDRSNAAQFERAAVRCRSNSPALVFGGPWAPYSFATEWSAHDG